MTILTQLQTCWPETPSLHEFLSQTMMRGLISFSILVQPRLMIQHLTQFVAVTNINPTLFNLPLRCNEPDLFFFGHQVLHTKHI
jgi:hypothetical protein